MNRRLLHFAHAGAAALARCDRPAYPPLELWIEPTSVCPGGCRPCPQRPGVESRAPRIGSPHPPGGGQDEGSAGRGIMSEAVLTRILGPLRRWRPHVNLHHRGEPFLHPRLVEVIRTVAGTGARVTLHTGAHVPPPAPPAAILAAGLAELVVSLGAATPEGFARLRPGADRQTVIATARRFLAHRPAGPTRVIVEVFQTPEAARELRAARALFAEAPPSRFRLRPLHSWTGLDEARPPGPAAARLHCLFPFYALVILADGRVTACPQDFQAELVVGDLRETSLEAIWQGAALRHLRRRTGRDLAAHRPCADCSLVRRRGLLGLPVSGLIRFGPRKILSRDPKGSAREMGTVPFFGMVQNLPTGTVAGREKGSGTLPSRSPTPFPGPVEPRPFFASRCGTRRATGDRPLRRMWPRKRARVRAIQAALGTVEDAACLYLGADDDRVLAAVTACGGRWTRTGAAGPFARVLVNDLLEHAANDLALVAEAAGRLAPGGRLIAAAPLERRHLLAFVARAISLADEDFGHRRGYTLERLTALLTAAGLEVTSVRPFGRPVNELLELTANAALAGFRRGRGAASPALPRPEDWSGRRGLVAAGLAFLVRVLGWLDYLPGMRVGAWALVVARRAGSAT